MRLLVATSNAGKLTEIREILGTLFGRRAPDLVSLADLSLPVPEETGETFQANADLKATVCARRSGLWALADDSGLCVDALDGEPGLRSARYAPTEEARRGKLLRALAGVPAQRRGAHFFCAVCLSDHSGTVRARAEGRIEGRIAEAPRGTHGFGYDPLFLPAEVPGATLAELPEAEKNRLSHRGRALRALAPELARLLGIAGPH